VAELGTVYSYIVLDEWLLVCILLPYFWILMHKLKKWYCVQIGFTLRKSRIWLSNRLSQGNKIFLLSRSIYLSKYSLRLQLRFDLRIGIPPTVFPCAKVAHYIMIEWSSHINIQRKYSSFDCNQNTFLSIQYIINTCKYNLLCNLLLSIRYRILCSLQNASTSSHILLYSIPGAASCP
jgi:hypothetical protein